MSHKILFPAAFFLGLVSTQARATGFQFAFGGQGVSGSVSITYGTAADTKTPGALEVTDISGTFSDANIGIFNATITNLEAVNHASPEPTNLLAPNDFSHFVVTSGTTHGFLSYDNLYYPGGSPQTATSYPFHGGFVDIYGLLFDIGNGRVVNFWSNGVLPGTDFIDYGVSVDTAATALDTIESGVATTPEPAPLYLLASGLLALLCWKRSSLLTR